MCISTSEALSSGYSSVQLSRGKKEMDCVPNTHFYLHDLPTFSFSVLRLLNLGVRVLVCPFRGGKLKAGDVCFFPKIDWHGVIR